MDSGRNDMVRHWNLSAEFVEDKRCRRCSKNCHEAFNGDLIISCGECSLISHHYSKHFCSENIIYTGYAV